MFERHRVIIMDVFFCWFIIVVLLTCVCAHACVRACMHVLRACVCVCERERETVTNRQRQRHRERDAWGCVCVCVCVCVYNFIPIKTNTRQNESAAVSRPHKETVFTISRCC